jgi:hypothetical protein
MKKIYILIPLLLAATFSQAQWEPDVRLTNDTSRSGLSISNAWCIASGGDTVHVVWYDKRDGNFEVYYKRSTDAGLSWGQDARLTNDTAGSFTPSVAASGSLVHIAWTDMRDGNAEIYYKRSTDGGVTWGADMRLTNGTAQSGNVSVSADGPRVHVVWKEYDPQVYVINEVHHIASANGGLSWGQATILNGESTCAFNQSVASSGLDVYTVCSASFNNTTRILFNHSTDGGSAWGTQFILSDDQGAPNMPSITVSGSLVLVVWYDFRNYFDQIYYKRSTDKGVTWGPDMPLTDELDICYGPNIASEGSTVNVVWRDNNDGNNEIYIKRSPDGGLNWEPVTRLTDNEFVSQFPSVSISGSVTHVVWADTRDGNQEIYYKRNPSGGVITGLSATPSIQNVGAAAGSTAFTVISGTNWLVSSDASWCTVTASGTGNGKITASFTENTSPQPRTAHIHVTGAGLPGDTVMLIQAKSSIGIEEHKDAVYKVCPNPTKGLFRIIPPGVENGSVEVIVQDLNGMLILKRQFKGEKEYEIDLSAVARGIYVIWIKTNDNILVRKLIIN